MNNEYLLNTIELDCPICNKVHPVEVRKRLTQGLVKGEVVEYDEVYYLCPLCDEEDNEFVPAGIMDNNLLKARDSYRKNKGLLTSGEIAKIRDFYGLSQSDFSAILGWGEVTVTRYESKSIQDETYDNIMKMTYENPMFALESLDKHKDRFTADKYWKIRKNIADKVEQVGRQYLKIQEIKSLYINYQKESEYNGYKKLDIDKLASVVGYYSNFINDLYKVKLMKLLWYTDALFYKRYKKSMTGLVYKHMPLGALPVAYDEILFLKTVNIVEEMIYNDIAYKIVPNKDVNISDFTLEELNVLETVACFFKDFTSKEIIDYMHKEKAYLETEPYQIIPYGLASCLNDLK